MSKQWFNVKNNVIAYKSKVRSKANFLFFSAIIVILSASNASAGAPLINLRGFFEDLFRVHIEGTDNVNASRTWSLVNLPADDLSKKRGLHLSAESQQKKDLRCADFVFRDYQEWREKIQKFRNIDEETKAQRRASDPNYGFVPNLGTWLSPALAGLGPVDNHRAAMIVAQRCQLAA